MKNYIICYPLYNVSATIIKEKALIIVNFFIILLHHQPKSSSPPSVHVSQQSWEDVVKEDAEKTRNLQSLARSDM